MKDLEIKVAALEKKWDAQIYQQLLQQIEQEKLVLESYLQQLDKRVKINNTQIDVDKFSSKIQSTQPLDEKINLYMELLSKLETSDQPMQVEYVSLDTESKL